MTFIHRIHLSHSNSHLLHSFTFIIFTFIIFTFIHTFIIFTHSSLSSHRYASRFDSAALLYNSNGSVGVGDGGDVNGNGNGSSSSDGTSLSARYATPLHDHTQSSWRRLVSVSKKIPIPIFIQFLSLYITLLLWPGIPCHQPLHGWFSSGEYVSVMWM